MSDNQIVFLGDSIIEGYGVSPEDCWVSRFSEEAINCGVSGDTTKDILRRLSLEISDAETVVLMIGINDLLNGSRVPDVTARIEQIIAQIRQLPAQPVLCTYPEPDYDELLSERYVPPYMYSFPERLRELHRWLRQTAEQEQFVCIDFAHEVQKRAGNDRVRLLLDGVHPNRYGHLMMSEIAQETLN